MEESGRDSESKGEGRRLKGRREHLVRSDIDVEGSAY